MEWLQEFMQVRFFEREVWRWASFVGGMLLSLVGSRLIERWVEARIGGWVEVFVGTSASALVGVFTPVVRWAILLTAAHVAVLVLLLPPEVHRVMVEVFKAAYALLVAFIFMRAVRLLLEVWTRQHSEPSAPSELRANLIPAVERLIGIIVFISTVLLVLQNAGYNVVSLITGLGVGGLAVALAAQQPLANLFGSITILMDRSIRLGDRIQVNGYDGIIERVGLRTTQLRQLDGTLASIPNKIIAESAFNNVSARPAIRHDFTISLVYDTTPEQMANAVKLIKAVLDKHPLNQRNLIGWRTFSAASLDIPVTWFVNTTDWALFLQSVQEINLSIKQSLTEAGLDFAFPTQTIHVKTSAPSFAQLAQR